MRHGITLLFVLLLACGCVSSRKQAKVDTTPLAPGDCITIVFDGPFEQNGPFSEVHKAVDSEGDILMPLISKIHLAGLTLEQAAERIEGAYIPKYFPDLKVSVSRCP